MPSISSNKKKTLLKTLLAAANCGCGCAKAPKPSHLHHPTPISNSKSSHNQNNPLSIPNPPCSSSTSVNNEKTSCTASTSTSTVTKSELSEEIIKEGCKMIMNNTIAVVKESEEPYKDFRHSMLQMIFEKEIFSKQDLQRLLNCFLQLNCPSQHPVIIQVFTEICDLVISKHPSGGDKD